MRPGVARRAARIGLIMLAGGGAAGLAGCQSPGPSVDHRQIERQLVSSVQEQKPGVATSAVCPQGLRAKRGLTFECTVRIGGNQVRYTVTVSDVHGGQFDAETRPTDPVLDTTVIAATIRQDAAAETAGAAVSCGANRFVQLAVNGTLTCTVTRASQTTTVAATVTDDGGDVSLGPGRAGAQAGTTVPAPGTGSPASPGTTVNPGGAPALPGD